MNHAPAIVGLILAAGESSRFGRDKALLPYRGGTFLGTTIATLREAGFQRISVVLGHHAEQIQQAVDLAGVTVVLNADYRQGQTSSLQAGLRQMGSRPPDAVLLCLVDHPGVSFKTLTILVTTFRTTGKAIVIPVFHGKHGHPVVIARPLLKELMALKPDEGANAVIRLNAEQTEFIEVDDPGVLLDVDDWESYRLLGAEP